MYRPKGQDGSEGRDNALRTPYSHFGQMVVSKAVSTIAAGVVALAMPACDTADYPADPTHQAPDVVSPWPFPASPSWGPGKTIIFRGDATKNPFKVRITNSQTAADMIVDIDGENQVVDVSRLDIQVGDALIVESDDDDAAKLETTPYKEDVANGGVDRVDFNFSK